MQSSDGPTSPAVAASRTAGAPTGSIKHERLWQTQWQALRSWIDEARVLEHGDAPSALAGWTVRDLVAHLGRSFVTASGATVSGESPVSILRYVSGYSAAAAEIDHDARARSADLGDALLTWLDSTARRAFAALAALDAPVLRGPRGPILRDDFVTTRLVELVVHADDLDRSMPTATGAPLLGEAVTAVALTLADAYAELTGTRPRAEPDLDWIRTAAGRTPSTDPHLPLL